MHLVTVVGNSLGQNCLHINQLWFDADIYFNLSNSDRCPPGTEMCQSSLAGHKYSENLLFPHFSNVLELYNTRMPALENKYSKNEFLVFKFPNEHIPYCFSFQCNREGIKIKIMSINHRPHN